MWGHFSEWFPWAERLAIPDRFGGHVHQYGGVYLLAHFRKASPAGPANYLDDAIVYVGEGGSLRTRWKQFDDSARDGRAGHSGGHSHRAWCEGVGLTLETLHVAAYPIWLESEQHAKAPLSLTVRHRLHVEQVVLWELVKHRRGRGRRLSLLNKK